MSSPIQKILFGSPGTGKSYQIKNVTAKKLDIKIASENYIPTVFHPEYTYGDFMGKLMPLSNDDGKVEYKFYPGHFLKALGVAYKNLINASREYDKDKKNVLDAFKKEIDKPRQSDFTEEDKEILDERQAAVEYKSQNVLLVIDEINRGNSSAIFGTVFQLLDRNKDGWSEYPIILSDLEIITLLKEIGLHLERKQGTTRYLYRKTPNSKEEILEEKEYKKYLDHIILGLDDNETFDLNHNYVKLPPNLSIIGTMNTSDNSIYFMDSAFKRRWDWEFVEIENEKQRESIISWKINLYGEDKGLWYLFVDKLNSFIRSNYKVIRKIEDKQVGYRFINKEIITQIEIKNKLMFFIWDSVFVNNKKPLAKLLELQERDMVTFGQFTKEEQVKKFVTKIIEQ